MLFAQDQAKIDSLNGLLESAEHDTTRAKVLIELGKQYRKGNLELAMEKYEQALSFARKARSKKWEAYSLNGIGIIFKMTFCGNNSSS